MDLDDKDEFLGSIRLDVEEVAQVPDEVTTRYTLSTIPEAKRNIPHKFFKHGESILKIKGSLTRALIADIIAFGAGFAALAVFGPTLK